MVVVTAALVAVHETLGHWLGADPGTVRLKLLREWFTKHGISLLSIDNYAMRIHGQTVVNSVWPVLFGIVFLTVLGLPPTYGGISVVVTVVFAMSLMIPWKRMGLTTEFSDMDWALRERESVSQEMDNASTSELSEPASSLNLPLRIQPFESRIRARRMVHRSA